MTETATKTCELCGVASPMVPENIPEPPVFWIIRYWDHGKWDWHLAYDEAARDRNMNTCREYGQRHFCVTIPGVQPDDAS